MTEIRQVLALDKNLGVYPTRNIISELVDVGLMDLAPSSTLCKGVRRWSVGGLGGEHLKLTRYFGQTPLIDSDEVTQNGISIGYQEHEGALRKIRAHTVPSYSR